MAKKFTGFTPDQQHVLLSKLGYTGPADARMMEAFLEATPSASAKMGSYQRLAQEKLDNTNLKLAKGGTVEDTTSTTTPVTTSEVIAPAPAASSMGSTQESMDAAQQALANATTAATANPTDTAAQNALKTAQNAFNATSAAYNTVNTPSAGELMNTSLTNPAALTPQAEAAKVEQKPEQNIAEGTGQVAETAPAVAKTVTETALATAPTATEAATVETAKTTPALEAATTDLKAATAEPSKKATVAGQLETLMSQFEGGATPPWASGAMRAAMGIMQQRGLGASSMAGQAVVQAAMESATAIASQDAQTQAQFEMQNLNNEQQTLIFKTQQRIAGILSDQAAENASQQFNASSKNQTTQFFAGLQESVSRFNADQINSVAQYNAGQENAIEQFNKQLTAQRDQFNATNSLVIAQANAKWRQDIALTDTAAQNEANLTNAKNAASMTAAALDAYWQQNRDLMAFAFTSSESALDRKVQLMVANKTSEIAKMQAKSDEKAGIGAIIGGIFAGL